MRMELAKEAMDRHSCLRLDYDGYSRTVEVHLVGEGVRGDSNMLVWQVRGGSRSGDQTGWKVLKLADVAAATILDEASEAPRDGYRLENNAIKKVIYHI